MKIESNIFTILEKDLLKGYFKVEPKKDEVFQKGDVVLIDRWGKTLTCAEISRTSYLVRKFIDITSKPEIYRKK